jgi:nucleotide-binding universal stress UspA family protein
MMPPIAPPDPMATFGELRQRAHGEMLEAAERELGPEIEWELCLGEGAAAPEIERVAKEKRADLVVIGTHGRTGLSRMFIGSVAEAVVRKAPCAVLVVRSAPAA